MHSEYIEQRNGGYYAGTLISLDSVVYAFNQAIPRADPGRVPRSPTNSQGLRPRSLST